MKHDGAALMGHAAIRPTRSVGLNMLEIKFRGNVVPLKPKLGAMGIQTNLRQLVVQKERQLRNWGKFMHPTSLHTRVWGGQAC
jgi:hypothetical protein